MYSRLKEEEKIATNVTTTQITRSTMTACHRLMGSPIDCRVRPEEYRSMVFTAKSVRMAKNR